MVEDMYILCSIIWSAYEIQEEKVLLKDGLTWNAKMLQDLAESINFRSWQ